MLSPTSLDALRGQVRDLIASEQSDLAVLREQAATLRHALERIHPRPVTSVSLVGTDGGNNAIAFDPLLVNLVRVVDSSQNEYHLEAVTPGLSLQELDSRQFGADGTPRTALGRLMAYVSVRSLRELCPVFDVASEQQRSLSWIAEYRGLHEWAVLFQLVRDKDFGTDTIVVRDGPFREKMLKPGIFTRLRDGLQEGLEHQRTKKRRRLYLVGITKHSKLLQKYRLALALERTFDTRYPCFAAVPIEMLRMAYRWKEWIEDLGTKEDFVGGTMFAAKFGSGPYDPVWLVDIFKPQAADAPRIMSFLLNDAINGFPVPYYPNSLQRAHDAAALVDFDMDVLQRVVSEALRGSLGGQAETLDRLALQDSDPSRLRY